MTATLRPVRHFEPVTAIDVTSGQPIACHSLLLPSQAACGGHEAAILPGAVIAGRRDSSGTPVVAMAISSGISSIGVMLYPAEAEELAALLLRLAAGGTLQ